MLLTALARSDRFCEGELEAAFNRGLLTRIVERARQLATAA
jgi:N-acetylglutamate synthase-like GNAT family acetyltransferase